MSPTPRRRPARAPKPSPWDDPSSRAIIAGAGPGIAELSAPDYVPRKLPPIEPPSPPGPDAPEAEVRIEFNGQVWEWSVEHWYGGVAGTHFDDHAALCEAERAAWAVGCRVPSKLYAKGRPRAA